MNAVANVQITAKSNPAGETAQDVKTGVSSTSVSDSNQHTMDQKDDQNDNTSESVLSSRCRLSMESETRAVDEDVRNSPMALKSNKAKAKILSLTSAAEDGPKVSFFFYKTARADTHT